MFTLRQLEFAVAVAEEGGFTAAAARCHTVQSALSHQIARLEEAFGTRLFERSHRQVRPTAAGEVFLHNARLTLQAAARLHEEMALTLGTVRGRINIGQITSLNVVDVPALLAAFRAAHPAVEVHLKVGMSDVLLAELEDGRLDVALVGVGPQISLPPQHRLLHEEGLSLVMPIDHPLTQHRTIPLQALQGLPLAALVHCANAASRRSCNTRSPTANCSSSWSPPGWPWRWCPTAWPPACNARWCARWSRTSISVPVRCGGPTPRRQPAPCSGCCPQTRLESPLQCMPGLINSDMRFC